MPHKIQTHLAQGLDASPLANNTESSATQAKSGKTQLKQKSTKDDTPRAFSRLFQPYRPPRSNEDTGSRPNKKRKAKTFSDVVHGDSVSEAAPGSQVDHRPVKGKPGNTTLATARASTRKESRSNPKAEISLRDISKASKTKLERKMQRMQQEWRLEDERLKAKRQAVGEDREGYVDESNVEEMGIEIPLQSKQGRKKRKNGRKEDTWKGIGNVGAEDRGLVGLHDVVQAPPRLKRPSAAPTPSKVAVGGLKRQVELSEGRRQVIEGYRAMMKQKREGIGSANV